MIRLFDILFSFIGLFVLSPIFLILVIIGFLDTGSPLFFQERMGFAKKPFYLIKFRSMHQKTIDVATHLVHKDSITRWGSFLRRSKLDELPQLLNVFIGDMSLVGPRPNLLNQNDLICEREIRGVYTVLPGITGLAQIKKIDMSTQIILAETDKEMITKLNIFEYFKYIILTFRGNGFGDRVKN